MTAYLSKDVKTAMAQGRTGRNRSRSRLRAVWGSQSVAVRRRWEGGFAVAAGEPARLRGLVDLFDGDEHVGTCLVVATRVTEDERQFEFKRFTQPLREAPLDFVRERAAPRTLLPAPAARVLRWRRGRAAEPAGSSGPLALG